MSSNSEQPLTTSSRLVLRRFAWDDVCAIVEGRRLEGWALDYPTEGDKVIAGILHRAGPDEVSPDRPWGHWQVLDRSTGRVIGGVGLRGGPVEGKVEMGYGIAPSQQGRGYATEAARAIVAVARRDGTVTAVVAGTSPDNRASQRVLEKVGFHCVGRGSDVRYVLDLAF